MSKAATAVTEAELKEAWTTSSFRPVVSSFVDKQKSEDLVKQAGEAFERSMTVARGLKEFSVLAVQHAFAQKQGFTKTSSEEIEKKTSAASEQNGKPSKKK